MSKILFICLASLGLKLLTNSPSKESFDALFCERTHFSERTLPTMALASYFGSGNTWTRQIIEKTTETLVKRVSCEMKRLCQNLLFICMASLGLILLMRLPSKESFDALFCERTHFSERTLPMIALASYFGSGNTWTRQIIEKATGIYTGCDYTDDDLKRNGFLGENIMNGSTVVVKTHEFTPFHLKTYQKAVLLIRNPYDAILSNFHLRHSKSHTGTATDEEFKKDWDIYVQEGAERWRNTYLAWLKFTGPLHIIRYEDLKYNFMQEVAALVKFLNFPILHKRLACVMTDRYEKFQRRKVDVQSSSLYSVEQKKIIDSYILVVENGIRLVKNE